MCPLDSIHGMTSRDIPRMAALSAECYQVSRYSKDRSTSAIFSCTSFLGTMQHGHSRNIPQRQNEEAYVREETPVKD